MDRSNDQSGGWRSWLYVLVAIALCWVLSKLSILSCLILPLLGYSIIRTGRRGIWWPMILLLLANPLTFYFIGGMEDYAKGAPRLCHKGLPNIESYNIDPRTRAFNSGGGCLSGPPHIGTNQGLYETSV